MKTEEKQILKFESILSILALGLALYLVIPPLMNSKESEERQAALKKAESLAYQIGAGWKPGQRMTRGPSSADDLGNAVGMVGESPWGKPYQYKVIPNEKGLQVEIWTSPERGEIIKTSVWIPKTSI